MNHAALYNNICQSIIKFVEDTRVEFAGSVSPGIGFLDWDEHANINELPSTDLIGPAGVGFEDQDGLFEITTAIGVSTFNDPSLFRLRSMMSSLYGKLKPMSKLRLYDHATQADISWMIATSPVVITPITRTEVRPLQFIELKLLADPHAPFAQ